jgi:anionic cell wall polymer biosynthesis LytR-Cps2A-Psr (LCP) family protein
MLKKFLKFVRFLLILGIVILIGLYLFELKQNDGNPTKATVGVIKKVVADSVTQNEPIYILLLGVNEDLSQNLTDTIMLLGYNPKTRKSFFNFNTKRYFYWK